MYATDDPIQTNPAMAKYKSAPIGGIPGFTIPDYANDAAARVPQSPLGQGRFPDSSTALANILRAAQPTYGPSVASVRAPGFVNSHAVAARPPDFLTNLFARLQNRSPMVNRAGLFGNGANATHPLQYLMAALQAAH